jgi:hypothetical protein
MVHQMFVLRRGIRTPLGLQFNNSNEDYVTFLDDARTALFDVTIPNPAWDDPSTSSILPRTHPPRRS